MSTCLRSGRSRRGGLRRAAGGGVSEAAEPDAAATLNNRAGLVFRIDGLRYRYPSADDVAVDGVSFDLADGEIFGFLGPSGAGKSTTQKILIGLLRDYQGRIEYRGRDLRSLGRNFYEDIGVDFEVPVAFSKLTALENLSFFSKLYRQTADVEPLLEQVGLWPDKDKKVGEYSKGMKVRLNFVRALLNKPTTLFLDEPTSGLDPVNSRIVKDMIADYRSDGGTVFLTSHIMSDVDELCDRVAFISRGRIAVIDTPHNLKLRYEKPTVTVEYRDGTETQVKSFSIKAIRTPEFHQLLDTNDIVSIHSGETTLEDVFVDVVGERLNG
jgi:fluoroquinolone transport system ATP-binding protein